MANVYHKNKPSDVDGAVKEAATSEEVNSVTDEQVSAERQAAGESIDNTIDKVTDNTIAATDDKNQGAPGAKVASLFKRVTGAVKPAGTGALARNARAWTPFPGAEANYSSADADHLERNASLAAIAFEQVQADIIREATAGTANGDTVIIGTPGDNNVYSSETDITAETVVGKGVYRPVGSPRARENGTNLVRGKSMISVSGDYIFSTAKKATPGLTAEGHDADKEFLDYENLLFNKLDQHNAVVSEVVNDSSDTPKPLNNGQEMPAFVMPKRGRFWVRGFTPEPKNDSPLKVVGTVTRGTDSEGHKLFCNVYQAAISGEGTKGIFDVVDVTPYADTITAATLEAAKYLTCAKSKFTMGQAEAIAQLFSKAQDLIDQPTEIITWPEYARNARSTLNFLNDGSNGASSCYNSTEMFVEFMHYLQESEIMYGLARINNEGLKDSLRFARNMEGQNAGYPYWRYLFKGDPSVSANCGKPTIAMYAASKSSHRAFNTMGKWIYTFRTFWSDLEAYCGAFDEGVLDERILSVIKIGKEACEEIAEALKVGTVANPESMTSATFVHGANQVDVVLAFDPNDIIDYRRDAAGNVYAYPSCGYINVYTRTQNTNSEYVTYNVCPTWLQVIAAAVSSPSVRARLAEATLNGASLKDYWAAGNYAPITIDTMVPSWFSLYFAEAFTLFKERVFSPRAQVSGFLRYLKAEETFAVADVYREDLVPLKQLIDTVCGGEGYFLDGNIHNPTQMPSLTVAEQRALLGEDIYRPFAFLHDFGGGSDSATKPHAIVFQVDKLHGYLDDFSAYEYHVGLSDLATGWHTLGEGGDGDASVAALHAAIKAGTFTLNSSPDHKDALVTAGDSVVVWRRVLKPESRMGVEVLQFGADPDLLGFDSNPEKYMYEGDTFRNLPVCDYFTLVIHFGDMAALGEQTDFNPALAVHGMAPTFVGVNSGSYEAKTGLAAVGTPANAASFCGYSAVVTHDGIAYASKLGTARNAMYEIPTVAAQTGNTAARVYAAEYRTIAGCDFVPRTITMPSLYGYRREVFAGASTVHVDVDGDVTRPNITEIDIQDGITDLHDRMIIQWRPRTIADELGEDWRDPTAVAMAIKGDTVDSRAVGDWTWFARTEMCVARPSNVVTADGASLQTADTAIELISAGNFACDVLQFQPDPVRATESDAGDMIQTGETVEGVEAQQFDRTASIEAVVAKADFDAVYYPNLFWIPNYAPITVAVKEATGNAEICFVSNYQENRNIQTRSRNYRNDYRHYYADRPVLRLNRNWYVYGLTAQIFADRFSKD